MFCSECGKEIADNSKFCPECGKPISHEVSKPESQTKEKKEGLKKQSIVFSIIIVFATIVIVMALQNTDDTDDRLPVGSSSTKWKQYDHCTAYGLDEFLKQRGVEVTPFPLHIPSNMLAENEKWRKPLHWACYNQIYKPTTSDYDPHRIGKDGYPNLPDY